MTRQNTLSPGELRLIERADEAVEELAGDYIRSLHQQFQTLSELVSSGDWDEAGELAHIMAGEAGTFDLGAVGEVAGLMRDVVQFEARETYAGPISLIIDSLGLMIRDQVQGDTAALDELVRGLRAVVAKIDSESNGKRIAETGGRG